MIEGKDYAKFSTLDEFRESIDMGLDIEFFIKSTRYNISWRDCKPFICTCPDGEAVFYDNADDLLNNHIIDGTTIGELWQNIEVISM